MTPDPQAQDAPPPTCAEHGLPLMALCARCIDVDRALVARVLQLEADCERMFDLVTALEEAGSIAESATRTVTLFEAVGEIRQRATKHE